MFSDFKPTLIWKLRGQVFGVGCISSFSGHLRSPTGPISPKVPLIQVEVPEFIRDSPLQLLAYLWESYDLPPASFCLDFFALEATTLDTTQTKPAWFSLPCIPWQVCGKHLHVSNTNRFQERRPISIGLSLKHKSKPGSDLVYVLFYCS